VRPCFVPISLARRNAVRVGIIGTGLIGSSIGLACRERGDDVAGFDSDSAALESAVRGRAIDAAAPRSEIYETCDAVVIATPLDVTIEEVRALRERRFRAEQFVIDVASVKAAVEEAASGIEVFVPTHPMAGSQKSGPAAARADLFEGRSWCYVATRDERRTKAARAFIEGLGARSFVVDAREHDRILGLTSHAPQAIAYAFKRCVDRLLADADGTTVSALCGPVATELLRIGGSSRAMWDPIFGANAANIAAALRMLERELENE
jgi:prephenate dehydrogenase